MSTKREEMLRKKAEDEARKAGTLPPEKDSRGQIINPHIPEFMAKVPWYMQSGEENQVGLDHQRLPENKKDHSDIGVGWYDRGSAAAKQPSTSNQRFEKGACTNCGATTHNAKNCLEKPRKLGASQLGKRLAQDDTLLPDLRLSYDGKRDNYNGFSAETQLAQVQQRKLLKLQQQAGNETTTNSAAAAALPSNTLRVRTDTAKYLRNLDPESAFYDPKTRSMRANPTPHLDSSELSFAGDNFIKNSGEVAEFEQVEEFAQGNLMANPTAVALQRKQFVQLVKKGEEEAMAKRKATELEYTGGASLAAAASALPSSSTCYFEYTKDGRLVNTGETDIVTSSRFEEDVFEGNHSQIWGSYLDDATLAWGYSCCFQTIRKSYCIGERGREAVREAKLRMQQAKEGTLAAADSISKPVETPPPKREKTRVVHDDASSSDSSSNSSDWNTSSEDEASEKRSKKKRKSSDKKKRKSHKKKKSHKKSRKHDNKRDKVNKPPLSQQSFQGGGFQPEDNEQTRQARIRPGDPMMGNLGGV